MLYSFTCHAGDRSVVYGFASRSCREGTSRTRQTPRSARRRTDYHTGAIFSGSPIFPLPRGSDVGLGVPRLGTFVGRNLTRDKDTGLGDWTNAEVVAGIPMPSGCAAIRRCVGLSGSGTNGSSCLGQPDGHDILRLIAGLHGHRRQHERGRNGNGSAQYDP
jgi:hypothetical protein